MDPNATDEPAPPPSIDEAIVALTRPAPHAVEARPPASQLTLIVVGAAGVLAGIVCVLAFTWLRGDAPVQTAAAAAAPTAAPTVPAAATKPVARTVLDSGPAPTWTGSRTPSWANDGSKTVSFQLEAMGEVPVWMARVRPALVVRCLSRATQAYVVIGASTRFEDDTYRRTVRLQWDDGPEMAHQWKTSESGQELFAPDGISFVQQLTQVHRLRFGFAPFNAKPATVEFIVDGFEPLARVIASTCGWRL